MQLKHRQGSSTLAQRRKAFSVSAFEKERREIKVAVQTILAEFAYQNVRVSIDNDEWQFNSHHLDELEKSDLKATVTSSDPFIARTQEWTCHFWSPDIRLAGRDVKLSY